VDSLTFQPLIGDEMRMEALTLMQEIAYAALHINTVRG